MVCVGECLILGFGIFVTGNGDGWCLELGPFPSRVTRLSILLYATALSSSNSTPTPTLLTPAHYQWPY